MWATASEQVRERLRDEELSVVMAAIRADPWTQLEASLRNFWEQLGHFGMAGSYFPDPYLEARIREALPGLAERYFRSREARRLLHE